jgi:ATP-dependent DNA helicase RecQ
MLEKKLQKYFNFSTFRSGQREVVEAILAGKDVVALMPTGGGKSLCYQLPSIVSGKLSIVISPLIALMKDQVDALNARGIGATYINSGLTASENKIRIEKIKSGEIKILYIAPERFGSREFQNDFSDLTVNLLAVDEAHCVSQWGHDFRPDYLKIKEYLDLLKKRPIVAAFTATATTEVKDDIVERLALKNPAVFIRGFDRPNLRFFAQSDLKEKDRRIELIRIIKSLDGSGIVYSLTRKNCESIAKELKLAGIKAVAYHAGLASEKRSKIQNDFMENRYQVIVATIAFGMGIDKSDIRFVIHSGMPASLEGYYQEAGRAGRDGEMAYCILLHSKKDNATHNFFIQMSRRDMLSQGKSWEDATSVIDIKYDRLEKMKAYVFEEKCRRKNILKYFDDPAHKTSNENCKGCDICLGWKGKKNNAKKDFERKEKKESGNILSATVLETVTLYEKKYEIEKIAKIRGLGKSTIYEHLIRWYEVGGNFEIEKYVTKEEEKQIFLAMNKAENPQFLGQIRQLLPDEIGYEKIRMVIAKIKKVKI